ncbi:DUF805 domain-containing protein [Curtobacterium sp. MCLR17_007]|uniref:DUF805 domain-containing protein n=1 Tax=unclassified Curtobacterium TaxID=257496 RepID=UPI0009E88BC1|nr:MULTISPECIES: DUF805 domain-containing protein [unclassified Curtobacterium]WIB59139.1 DUF805 domain-containing protein [Curtobacterium sp. MCLR17_007]
MTDQYPPQDPYAQPPGAAHTPQYGAPAPVGNGGEPPLWAPWYGISFGRAFGRFWKKYVRFDGRASRSEFWWWVLWAFLASIVVNILDGILASATGTTVTSTSTGYFGVRASSDNFVAVLPATLWGLAILLPSIALLMRRLHDAGHSGWWWVIGVIPIIGWIVLFIMVLQRSRPEGQRYDRPDRG